MNTIQKNSRRADEEDMNEAVPPQYPQNSEVAIKEGAMYNVEIREVIHIFNHVLATHVSRDTRVKVNSNASTTASRIRDFTWMSPPTFFGSNMEED